MAKAVATRNTSTAIADPGVDYFNDFAKDNSRKNWVGTLLKFVKGDWQAGQDGADIPLGTRMVAVMPSLVTGWIKWSDGKPVVHEMGLVDEGFKAAPRESMGDTDESEWEEDNKGNKRDPWQKGAYLVLIDENENIFTFAAGSKGGMGAIGELASMFSKHRKMYPEQIPVVTLGGSSYKHIEYGKVPTPVLTIEDWVDREPFINLLNTADKGEDEPEAPKGKGKPKATGTPPQRVKKGNGSRIRF